jgi:hypothetical protein
MQPLRSNSHQNFAPSFIDEGAGAEWAGVIGKNVVFP